MGCEFEEGFKGADSPGPVKDAEKVCRGVYENHVEGSKIKKSALKKRDLADGSLSVWRLSQVDGVAAMASLLDEKGPADKALLFVWAPEVSALRQVRLEAASRALCVIDDTDTGGGDTHAAHAAIAACRGAKLESGSPVFDKLFDDVFNLFRSSQIWPSAGP